MSVKRLLPHSIFSSRICLCGLACFTVFALLASKQLYAQLLSITYGSASNIITNSTNDASNRGQETMYGIKRNTANISSLTFSCNNVTEIPQNECEALAALYNNTSGANWTNHNGWLVTNTPCSWDGVRCNNNRVTELLLYYNQLSGNIPRQLGNLTSLQRLELEANQLSGSIPPQLGNLTNLQTLRLDTNQLSGSIPPQLGNFTNLQWLDLSNNQLSGNISQLSNLTNLQALSLSNNQLSGNISQLGNFTNLRWLDLSNNQISGSIPSELGDLHNLTQLFLNNTQLSGALPTSLTNLTKLTNFSFDNTSLCEPIDATFQSWLAGITSLNRTNVPCASIVFKVSGIVQNFWKNGINGVVVQIGNQITTTDIYGRFSVNNLPNGTYKVSFTLSSYTFSSFPSAVTIQGADVTVNADGHYTDPIVDTGFRPSINGFSFSNFDYFDESWDIFKRAFPNTLMENSNGSHKLAADAYFKANATIGDEGNCYGFSQASIIWFTGLRHLETVERDVLIPPNSTANFLHNMIPRYNGNVNSGQSDVKDYIHIYQWRQNSIESHLGALAPHLSLEEVLQGIKDGVASFFNSPFSIGISHYTLLGAPQQHMIVPYKIEPVGLLNRIYVYDSNHPDDDNRYIEVDTQHNTWSYEVTKLNTWRGDNSNLIIQLAQNNFPATLSPKMTSASAASSSSQTFITVLGNVSSQLIDVTGRRMGIIDGQMIQEIPGASINIIAQFNPAHPNAPSPLLYSLPMTIAYTIDIKATSAAVYTVTSYTNGTVTSLQGIETNTGASDRIFIESRLRSLTLQTNQVSKDFCYEFADDNLNNASRAFSLCTSTAADTQTSFSVATDNTSFTYRYTGSPTSYELFIEQTGESAGSQVLHGQASSSNPITIRSGNTPDPNAPGHFGWQSSYFNYLPVVMH